MNTKISIKILKNDLLIVVIIIIIINLKIKELNKDKSLPKRF